MNGCTGDGPRMGELYEGLLKGSPANKRIVLKRYYNRDNNEVVEFFVLHQDIAVSFDWERPRQPRKIAT